MLCRERWWWGGCEGEEGVVEGGEWWVVGSFRSGDGDLEVGYEGWAAIVR